MLISHIGQFPATTVSFNLGPGASLGAAVEAIRQTVQKMGIPASIDTAFQRRSRSRSSASLTNTVLLILAAIVTMYTLCSAWPVYESYIHPITILSTLPSAGIGARCSR